MMRSIVPALVLALALPLAACGKDKKGEGGGGDDKAAAVEVSPEMKDFLSGFGSANRVEAALKKHGTEGLDTHDMEMYDLKDPTVTAKTGDCFTFDAKSGMTTRTYDVCWKGGKISSVADKGMR
jgi:predicted small secreted protein